MRNTPRSTTNRDLPSREPSFRPRTSSTLDDIVAAVSKRVPALPRPWPFAPHVPDKSQSCPTRTRTAKLHERQDSFIPHIKITSSIASIQEDETTPFLVSPKGFQIRLGSVLSARTTSVPSASGLVLPSPMSSPPAMPNNKARESFDEDLLQEDHQPKEESHLVRMLAFLAFLIGGTLFSISRQIAVGVFNEKDRKFNLMDTAILATALGTAHGLRGSLRLFKRGDGMDWSGVYKLYTDKYIVAAGAAFFFANIMDFWVFERIGGVEGNMIQLVTCLLGVMVTGYIREGNLPSKLNIATTATVTLVGVMFLKSKDCGSSEEAAKAPIDGHGVTPENIILKIWGTFAGVLIGEFVSKAGESREDSDTFDANKELWSPACQLWAVLFGIAYRLSWPSIEAYFAKDPLPDDKLFAEEPIPEDTFFGGFKDPFVLWYVFCMLALNFSSFWCFAVNGNELLQLNKALRLVSVFLVLLALDGPGCNLQQQMLGVVALVASVFIAHATTDLEKAAEKAESKEGRAADLEDGARMKGRAGSMEMVPPKALEVGAGQPPSPADAKTYSSPLSNTVRNPRLMYASPTEPWASSPLLSGTGGPSQLLRGASEL